MKIWMTLVLVIEGDMSSWYVSQKMRVLKGVIIPGKFVLVSTKNMVSVCFLVLN